jgi:hypothetical protein
VLGRGLRACRFGGIVAALSLLAAFGLAPRSAPADPPSMTHITAALGANCIEGHFWPAGVPVDINVRNGAGNIVYSTTATTDPSGHFWVNLHPDRVHCEIPVTLAPGMRVTASDGTTTKSLLIETLSFDQLDPGTQTAAGTAPAGKAVQVSVYWDALPFNPANNVYITDVVAGSQGDWFVDVRAMGGQVDSTSLGGVFLPDDGADGNFDFTTAPIYVTAVSLSASTPAVATSAVAGAAGARQAASGRRVRLSGRLKAGDKVCTKRKRVRLLKVVGKRTKALASSRTTKKGRYSFLRNVARTTSFKVRYRGDQICQRSESRIKTVRVGG